MTIRMSSSVARSSATQKSCDDLLFSASIGVMTFRKKIPSLVLYPTPSLLERSVEIDDPTAPEITDLINKLQKNMRSHDGIGIAAPQIGRNLRIFLVQTDDGIIPFINPVILERSTATSIEEEGCLSIPSVYGMVERPTRITIEASLPDGTRPRYEADQLFARVIQHEYDHLEGVLFINKAKSIRNAHLLKKLEAQLQQKDGR
jgi:peptide deformylase